MEDRNKSDQNYEGIHSRLTRYHISREVFWAPKRAALLTVCCFMLCFAPIVWTIFNYQTFLDKLSKSEFFASEFAAPITALIFLGFFFLSTFSGRYRNAPLSKFSLSLLTAVVMTFLFVFVACDFSQRP